jgi:Arginase family
MSLSLDRDNSNNVVNAIEFILSLNKSGLVQPENFKNETPQKLFDLIAENCLELGHSVDASLADLSKYPRTNLSSGIRNIEQIIFDCRSAKFRTEQAINNNVLPINLALDSTISIGSINGALQAVKKVLPDNKFALLHLDCKLGLKNKIPCFAEEIFLTTLLQKDLQNLNYQTLLKALDFPVEQNILVESEIINLGLNKLSSVKPAFRYYSIDLIQEFGLNIALKEIEEIIEAENIDRVYVFWDMSIIQNAGLNLREAFQVANWIDLKLRRSGKLLGLDFIGLKEDQDFLQIQKDLLLRILGQTLFFNS